MSSRDDDPAAVHIRLLGPFEVLRWGQAVDLPGGRARSLLALLSLYAGQVISSERLIDDLWGERPPSSARTLVHGFVSRLRKALDRDEEQGSTSSLLETVGAGYRLTVGPESVDVNEFRRLVNDARSLPLKQRESTLAAALDLWRGPALVDFEYEPFAQRVIASINELRASANEELVEARLEMGQHSEVIADLEALIETYPYRERLRGQLMLALFRAGRQADALEAFQNTKRLLGEELGIEPGSALRVLEERILVQDPGLDTTISSGSIGPSESHQEASWLPRERRTVTAMFVDLAPVDVDLDPEAGRRAMAEGLEVVAQIVQRHGGRLEESVGDVVVALFGKPVAHEDDPLRALRAALEARYAVGKLDPMSGFRAALETGEIVSGSANRSGGDPAGPPITLAARLHQAADPGDILIGPAAMRLVHGSAVVAPVARPDPQAWRLLEVDPDATLLPRHFHTPTVGRVQELSRLRTTFSRTTRDANALRLTVIGEAGIGKSRLSRDFARSISDRANIATTTCHPEGYGGTFSPLHDLLVQAGGVPGWPELATLLEEEEEGVRLRDYVAGAIGLGPVIGSPQELFAEVRRAFEVTTGGGSLAAVIDDVHWAEETLLDLIEYLAENLEAPVLFLCLARPELLELHPEWRAGTARSDLLFLGPLGGEDIDDIVREHADVDLAPDIIQKITSAAQGNPLFAEQLLAAFQNEETDTVPASLRSLLATRIDQLGPGERDLLRSAAVAGDLLSMEALEALVPDRAGTFLTRNLRTLERRRLLSRSNGEDVHFAHGLIRDAAYQSLALADRAGLHLQFARWLEAKGPGQPFDSDIAVGFHLEQAILCSRQLGRDDPEKGLADRAGKRLAMAGSRAFARLDLPAAQNLLERALALLQPSHPQHLVTAQHLAEVSLPLGHHSRAQELLLDISERSDIEPPARWSARVERARSLCLTGPDPVTHKELSDLAFQAFEYFADTDDDKGRAQAMFLQGQLAQLAGRQIEATSFGRRSMRYADRSHAQRERLSSRYLVVEGLINGPDPVKHCVAEAESLMLVDGAEHPIVMLGLARLHAASREFDEARALIGRARDVLVERFRIRRLQMFVELAIAATERLAGNLEAAERSYRSALMQVRKSGERSILTEVAARLSLLLAARDRTVEARDLARESQAAAPSENRPAQAMSRAAVALTLPPERLDEAVIAAEASLESVPAEMPTLRADLLVELATVAKASGRVSTGQEQIAQAVDLYDEKGNLAAVYNLN